MRDPQPENLPPSGPFPRDGERSESLGQALGDAARVGQYMRAGLDPEDLEAIEASRERQRPRPMSAEERAWLDEGWDAGPDPAEEERKPPRDGWGAFALPGLLLDDPKAYREAAFSPASYWFSVGVAFVAGASPAWFATESPWLALAWGLGALAGLWLFVSTPVYAVTQFLGGEEEQAGFYAIAAACSPLFLAPGLPWEHWIEPETALIVRWATGALAAGFLLWAMARTVRVIGKLKPAGAFTAAMIPASAMALAAQTWFWLSDGNAVSAPWTFAGWEACLAFAGFNVFWMVGLWIAYPGWNLHQTHRPLRAVKKQIAAGTGPFAKAREYDKDGRRMR